MAELRQENTELRRANAELRETIAMLQRGRDSQNSSKPPSSDPPSVKLGPPKEPTGRKPGGQPGHKGNYRKRYAPERVDKFVDHWPTTCGGCNEPFPEKGRREAGEPASHQVVDLPPLRALVTEHRMHRQHCHCGSITTAPLPPNVPRGAFGPQVGVVAALLAGKYRVSKRSVAEIFRDLLGIDTSVGTISALEAQVSRALEQPVSEAHAFVQSQPVISADETSWRESRRRAWLWVASTPSVSFFQIRSGRSANDAKELLGSFDGHLIADRYHAYKDYGAHRQYCWAHMKRDFHWMSERSGSAGFVGTALLELCDRVFDCWHRFRRGEWSREDLRIRIAPLRPEVNDLLLHGLEQERIAGMCREVLRQEAALWTFVDVNGVDPTNNAAERAVRPAVIWRKICYGTHSKNGSRFAERILTVVATLRQQGRNVFEYLTSLIDAAANGRPLPSLVPT
jgi:transposase